MKRTSLLLLVVLAACSGSVDIREGEAPEQPGYDSGQHRDVGSPPSYDASQPGDDTAAPSPDSDLPDDGPQPDTHVPEVCDPAQCGEGASCQDNVCTCDEGLFGDPLQACTPANPCEAVTCPDGASCNPDGSCSCDPFFTGDGVNGCVPRPADTNLQQRTKAEVCAVWTDNYQRSSNDFWMIEPTTECDFGVLHPEEQRQALHTTSRYRILVGLHPVSLMPSAVVTTQACATTHAAQGSGLDHNPPSTWKCYTPEGAAGAGSSNLASGIGQPAGTVGLYVVDNGVPSLGHRRWIFNPGMGRTAFGHRGRFGAMYAFDGSRNHSVEFVAYPSPGAFPQAALGGKWSIHGGGSYRDDFGVAIRNVNDDTALTVSDITAPVFGNLASTLSWRVASPALDTPYEITITNAEGVVVQQYTTTLVSCP